MDAIIQHFTDDDLYKFTMACAVIDNFPRTQVRYAFTDRDNRCYPAGFAKALEHQLEMLEDVTITDREIEFMRLKCTYIPDWFYSFLRGYRYNRHQVKVVQDASGHLNVTIEGPWAETIFFEVKLLAIISELYFRMTGEADQINYDQFAVQTAGRGRRLIDAGCTFSDFGTRRRASFRAQEIAVGELNRSNLSANGTGRFIGTSNVYLAMKHDVMPVGTMAHEFVCAIAGMFGPLMANHLAMEAWSRTFRGALGTFLYDTYGWKIFALNFSEDFANMFKGLRVDSGDNLEQLDFIIKNYRRLNIDPSTKQVIFSNALSVDKAIEIQKHAQGKCLPSFGIGTHFTNNFPGIKPLNIVIKLLDVKITESWPFFSSTCKLSEDHGKYTGDPDTVKRFMEILHIKTTSH